MCAVLRLLRMRTPIRERRRLRGLIRLRRRLRTPNTHACYSRPHTRTYLYWYMCMARWGQSPSLDGIRGIRSCTASGHTNIAMPDIGLNQSSQSIGTSHTGIQRPPCGQPRQWYSNQGRQAAHASRLIISGHATTSIACQLASLNHHQWLTCRPSLASCQRNHSKSRQHPPIERNGS